MIKNIIFDFDGTLVDSAKDVVICLKKAYLKHGVEVSISTLQTGPPLTDLIRAITPNLKQEDIEKIASEFRSCYDSCGYPFTKPYSGILELLDKLRSSGIKLFIVTNKRYLPTIQISKNLNFGAFSDVIAVDSFPEIRTKDRMVAYLIKKWGLTAKDTFLIGDSDSDIEAANKNGLISVGVTYGYGSLDLIIKSNPTHMINSIKELRSIILD